jgi:hypothetical protein
VRSSFVLCLVLAACDSTEGLSQPDGGGSSSSSSSTSSTSSSSSSGGGSTSGSPSGDGAVDCTVVTKAECQSCLTEKCCAQVAAARAAYRSALAEYGSCIAGLGLGCGCSNGKGKCQLDLEDAGTTAAGIAPEVSELIACVRANCGVTACDCCAH